MAVDHYHIFIFMKFYIITSTKVYLCVQVVPIAKGKGVCTDPGRYLTISFSFLYLMTFTLFFIEVQWTYNIALVSNVQHNDLTFVYVAKMITEINVVNIHYCT